jgi:hypothetical protein
MAKAIGIQRHRFFKLGKKKAKRDRRNLKFAAVLKAKVKLPATYDFDTTHPGISTPMFANDVFGCCVIAGRAHQTLRFEFLEQNKVLPIADAEVLKEYKRETGGPDTGLIVADSLKQWRHKGWKVGKSTYKIQAYAELNRDSRDEVKRAIYADVGVGIGVSLPLDAQKQLNAGQKWDVTTGSGAKIGGWGGHYVYVCGYVPAGPVCITWGRKQQMTWAWFAKYCDEAYTIFDANNGFKKSIVSTAKLTAFLDTVSPA